MVAELYVTLRLTILYEGKDIIIGQTKNNE